METREKTYDGATRGKAARVLDMVGRELLRPRVEGRDEGLREGDFRHG